VVNVHVDPCGHGGEDAHALTAHHDQGVMGTIRKQGR
jgi:hypothetical protein